MADERELARWFTALVRGTTNSKIGTVIITNERVLFWDQKFAHNAAAGVLTALIVDRLQKRHEKGGPLLDVPLSTITAMRRERKLLNKDRLALSTSDGEHLFNDGWAKWAPVLREALAGQGRAVVEDGPDAWSVQG